MKKRTPLYILGALGMIVLAIWAFDGSVAPRQEETVYLERFLQKCGIKEDSTSVHARFENELDFIQKVQEGVFNQLIGKIYPIPKEKVGDLQFYLEKGEGACYDRAILLEKILLYYKFPVRHAYVYFSPDSNKTPLLSFFNKRLLTHALMEVKTKNGWMIVETKEQTLGLDENKATLSLTTLKRLRSKNKNFTDLPLSWLPHDFRYVYGLYSRHGEFLHSPFENVLKKFGIPSFIPDYDLRMLRYNF